MNEKEIAIRIANKKYYELTDEEIEWLKEKTKNLDMYRRTLIYIKLLFGEKVGNAIKSVLGGEK